MDTFNLMPTILQWTEKHFWHFTTKS